MVVKTHRQTHRYVQVLCCFCIMKNQNKILTLFVTFSLNSYEITGYNPKANLFCLFLPLKFISDNIGNGLFLDLGAGCTYVFHL